MADEVLKLADVSLALGEGAKRVNALVGINLAVAEGEMVSVTGRSGSGKSSLLNVAGGLLPADVGSVAVAGESLDPSRPAQRAKVRRKSIGYVFQSADLVPHLTVGENVALPLELVGLSPKEGAERAAEALERVGGSDWFARRPDHLSGGQQQLVAIARGIVGERSLLIADEPTGALDDLTGEHIARLLRDLADSGTAVLLATHDQTLAGWADRVIRLRDGRIANVTERVDPDPDLVPSMR